MRRAAEPFGDRLLGDADLAKILPGIGILAGGGPQIENFAEILGVD